MGSCFGSSCLVYSVGVLGRTGRTGVQAAWSPQSEGAQGLQRSEPEKFQVYADGGAMLSEEVSGVVRAIYSVAAHHVHLHLNTTTNPSY